MFRSIRAIIEQKRLTRLQKMIDKVPTLCDHELKQWYIAADTSRITGHMFPGEHELFVRIESEMNRRGFVHMVDY